MNRLRAAKLAADPPNRAIAAALLGGNHLAGQAAVNAPNVTEAPQRYGQSGPRSPLTRHGKPNT